MNHEARVIEHITTGPVVAESSEIKYYAVCWCGWKSEFKQHLILAQLDAQNHDNYPEVEHAPAR